MCVLVVGLRSEPEVCTRLLLAICQNLLTRLILMIRRSLVQDRLKLSVSGILVSASRVVWMAGRQRNVPWASGSGFGLRVRSRTGRWRIGARRGRIEWLDRRCGRLAKFCCNRDIQSRGVQLPFQGFRGVPGVPKASHGAISDLGFAVQWAALPIRSEIFGKISQDFANILRLRENFLFRLSF